MKSSKLKAFVISLTMALMATGMVVTPAFAWHVNTGECTVPGTSGWVKVPDADWTNGYKLYVFTDGQLVDSAGRGEKIDLPAGDYVGKWSKDGATFLPEKEYFTIHNDCPPLKPDLAVSVSCVANGGPVQNYVQMRVEYDTQGPEMKLVQKLTIDTQQRGTRYISFSDTVWDSRVLTRYKYVGRGTHHVYGYVELGHKLKRHIDEYVTCAPVINRLKASFGNTRGDPWETGRASNKMNSTAQDVIWEYRGRDGWVERLITIPPRCRWVFGWNWVEAGSTMTIKWIKPSGARVLLAKKQVPPPGYYGKIPPTYRGYICP